MPKKKTHSEYLEDLRQKNIEYIPLEEYINSSKTIQHICKEGHVWSVSPNNILNGRGCPQCSRAKRTKSLLTYNEELKARKIAYIAIENYVSSNVPILHRCTFGHEWKARPNGILSAGNKCPKCSVNRQKTTSEYLLGLASIGINYEVLEDYRGARVPILHSCECGSLWKATPDNVLRGTGCPSCASYGFDPARPAILYYIKIVSYHQEVYYKIGITNNSVEKRFSKDKDKTIQILMQKQFLLGSDARAEEQSILDKYKSHRITIPDFLKSKGNTELFEIDILGLDT